MIGQRKRLAASAVAIAGAALVLAGCSTAGDTGSSGDPTATGDTTAANSTYLVDVKEGPYAVGLANAFAGNAWRTQMVAELQYYADQNPDVVSSLKVTDANNSVDTQISQINDLVSSGIDILLIDAASASALDNAVEQAWKQGVLVVSFDNPVDSEHAMVVNPSQEEFGKIGGEWLASKLKSGDKVVTLDGAAGSPVNDQRLAGATAALKAAGIEIVGSANTDWDQAQGQQATQSLLAANPDIKGIYSQGGAASLGAINAMEQRGGEILPITGEGYNGFLKKWAELAPSGFDSIAPSQAPSLSVTALKFAVQAISGDDPGREPNVPLDVIDASNLAENSYPDLADSLFLPTSLPDNILQEMFK